MRGAMPAAWAMSSARVALSPRWTKSPAAARAISIRVSAFRRSVRESCAEAGNDWCAERRVELIPAGYAHVAESAIRRFTPWFRYGVGRRCRVSAHVLRA
ncbi:hypothetical protein GCM10010503_00450 [Streptomyces lucensis JCM 4490]|uniref:Uncharacterized protein n=1 Tax=Streptomyces lucensis JCM 4490 TaxID=1306176 RepID=A0A918ISW5_9ACTN|nr:hypothetical protein GCM10010503_00450 [Streptomyces lucensis JCM 4490]